MAIPTFKRLSTALGSIFRNEYNQNLTDIETTLKEQKQRVDNLIQNTPQPDEVMDIRTGLDGTIYATAKDRLDADKQEHATQLADLSQGKVARINYDADKAYIFAQIQSLTNGFGKTFETYEQLTTELASNDGKNHVVQDDGDWYFWMEGFGWTSGGDFQSSGIADGSVNPTTTSFFGKLLNLINPDAISAEKNIYSTNGSLVNSANWATSDFIKVTSNTSYHFNKMANSTPYWGCYAFYDTNKNFVSYVNEGNLLEFTTPANAKYMRVAVFQKTNGVYNLLLVNLNENVMSLPTNGTKYEFNIAYIGNQYIEKDDAPTEDSKNPITSNGVYRSVQTINAILDGKAQKEDIPELTDKTNLINPDTINLEQTLYSTNGSLFSKENWATTDYIEAFANTNYHVNKMSDGTPYWGSVAFYDSNKSFISPIIPEGSLTNYTTPANAKYMRVAVFQKTNNVYRLLMMNLCQSSITLPANGTKYEYGVRFIPDAYLDKDTMVSQGSNKPVTGEAVYKALQTPPQLGDSLNLVNPDTVNKGYGLYNGGLIASGTYNTTDFIEVSPSTVYKIKKYSPTSFFYGGYAFYNESKGFISQSPEGTLSYKIQTTDKTKFIRIFAAGTNGSNGIPNVANVNLCKDDVEIPNYPLTSDPVYQYNQRFIKSSLIDLPKQFGWKFKNMVSFGDSLVAQGRWQNQVVNYFKMQQINCGQGGSRVGGQSFVASDGETKIPMWTDTRINAIPWYTDLIIIHGGTNDKGATPIADISSTDVNEFYGAYKTMLEKMMARCPNARIVLLQPFWNVEENDGILENYREAIRDIGDYFGFPVIESKKVFGFNYSNYTRYFMDNTHVNYAGGNRVADYMIGYLKSIAPYNSQTIALSAYSASLSVGGTTTITTNGIAVTWTSSDTSIANVDSAGKITAVAAGTATITATDNNNNTATVNVTIA